MSRAERLERGGTCRVLKLRLTNTQRVQMKAGLPWLGETEVNGDLNSTNEKKSFLGWFVGLCMTGQEIFVLSWLLVVPVQKGFVLTVHYFSYAQ
jgi:hypothetical protein